MLASADNARDDSDICRVVISKLLYEDLWPCQVRISGVDPHFEPLVITSSGVFTGADGLVALDDQDRDGDEMVSAEHAADDGLDLFAGAFDFMSLLEEKAGDEQTASKKRRTDTARRTRVPTLPAEVDLQPEQAAASCEGSQMHDILEDPNLIAAIGQDCVRQLKNAREICSGAASAKCAADEAAASGQISDTGSDAGERDEELDLVDASVAEASKARRLRGKDGVTKPRVAALRVPRNSPLKDPQAVLVLCVLI